MWCFLVQKNTKITKITFQKKLNVSGFFQWFFSFERSWLLLNIQHVWKNKYQWKNEWFWMTIFGTFVSMFRQLIFHCFLIVFWIRFRQLFFHCFLIVFWPKNANLIVGQLLGHWLRLNFNFLACFFRDEKNSSAAVFFPLIFN